VIRGLSPLDPRAVWDWATHHYHLGSMPLKALHTPKIFIEENGFLLTDGLVSSILDRVVI